MPMKPEIVQAYAASRRYSRLLSVNGSPFFQQYKQFFVDCSDKKRKFVAYFVSSFVFIFMCWKSVY